ncbi:hypothetical protein WJX84_003914 [Apatococcus fuscideae]|uniref:Uncharacterized protein n=1 Tax=Apatococcus fuscideae TaxID=2026836 RepID=A0AAW1TAW7_9CHLO
MLSSCWRQFPVTFAARRFTAAAASADRVALIQGSSRGLGLEYAKQLLSRPGHRVIGTCRDPGSAHELQKLQDSSKGRLSIVRLDVTDEQTIQAAAEEVSKQHGHLDLLINVTGILHIPGKISPETALSRITPEALDVVFKTNAFGPILTAKAFAPLLEKAESCSGASNERPAVVANMSARVGSLADNRLGGWYSYRSSKTALNQLTKCMCLEFARKHRKIAGILLHPGTVDTGLSEPFQKNVKPEKLFTRERAVQQLLGIIDSTTMKDNGRYIAWDGQDIPW